MATAPRWEQFLSQVMNNDGHLIAFLQKCVGYTLTGDTREQALFLAYGGGSNGKSVFISTLLQLMGDYGKSTRTETLLSKKYDGIPNDVARLHGARLVAAVESEAGRRLAEALVKQLTGGDTICARFLRREFFEFRPTFKVWLAVNHKPTVRGTDHAIWRRIRPIPFTVTIPDEQQDKTLDDKLKTELPGILAWAVRGTHLWLQDGLTPPEAVKQATQTYREEMDVLGAFLRECCMVEPDAKETAASLYGTYKEAWCKESGEKPITKTAFGIALRERGLQAKVHRGAQHWFGVRLRTELDPVREDDVVVHGNAEREEVHLDAD
jgi:putative DNA primase/helicase